MNAPGFAISFDGSAKKFVLGAFGKTLDQEKFVVEQSNPSQRVLTPKGEEVRFYQFAGIRKGSEIYIKSDIASLIEASEHLP